MDAAAFFLLFETNPFLIFFVREWIVDSKPSTNLMAVFIPPATNLWCTVYHNSGDHLSRLYPYAYTLTCRVTFTFFSLFAHVSPFALSHLRQPVSTRYIHKEAALGPAAHARSNTSPLHSAHRGVNEP